MKLQEIIDNNLVLTVEDLINNKELVKEVQERLALLDLYPDNLVDGIFGSRTDYAIKLFCEGNWLNNHKVKKYGKTFALKLLEKKIVTKSLNIQNLKDAAAILDVELAAIRAVVAIESAGSGFLKSGKPQILFEAHHFSKHTSRKYDTSHPNLSSRIWNPQLYKGGEHEWNRFNKASLLNSVAAIKSSSWGLFQILGSNARSIGYKSEEQFCELMHINEMEHLLAFIRFVEKNNLVKYLRNKQWTNFAKRYNGVLYYKNQYDVKMAQAYAKYKQR